MRSRNAGQTDSLSVGFGLRLLHLSLYTFIEVAIGITMLVDTPATLDMLLVREAAAALRQDPVVTWFVHTLGAMHLFIGLSAYLMRDRVLDDPRTARPFYLSMIGLHIGLWYFAWRAEQEGVAAPSELTVPAGAIAVVFGGGAFLARRHGPASEPWVDMDDEPGAKLHTE